MQKRGYLGKYTGQVNFIKEDGIQSMIFFEGDDVPIHLSIRHEIPIIEEGWVGKPKRMFQILYERGFLDLTKLNLYTV